jgi:hypothetical protein
LEEWGRHDAVEFSLQTDIYAWRSLGPAIITLFPKEITVHSGIVWRDKLYGDRRQICERVEVSIIKVNFSDDQIITSFYI